MTTLSPRRLPIASQREWIVNPRVGALGMSLCVLAGLVFQGTTSSLKCRAEVVGLIWGAQNRGWIWLPLLRTVMWLPTGMALLRVCRSGFLRPWDLRERWGCLFSTV